MRLATFSWLLALVVGLWPLLAAAQVELHESEVRSPDAAGWTVLEHAPRLSAPTDTAQELKRILAQDEYQGPREASPRQSWFSRMWEQLQEALSAMSSRLTGTWGAVLAVMLVVLLAFLVVRLLWQWAARGSGGALEAAGRGQQQQTAEQLLEAASLAAERGEFRAAIRFRYLALLRALNLATTALLTNSQIKRRVSRRYPALQLTLGQLVAEYEDSWYGGLAMRREDYERASELAREIEQVITQGTENERSG